MDGEQLRKKAFDLGFEYEKNFGGCSQCSIAAIQDTLNLRNDFVFKAASGLAAGAGLLGVGLCGSFSGCVMAMSTLFGRNRNKIGDDQMEKYCSFHMAAQLHDRFVKKYGSVICQKIQENIFGRSYNLWDEKERKEFEKAGAHVDKCTTVVADGAGWATELIIEEINRRDLTLNDFSHVIHIST